MKSSLKNNQEGFIKIKHVYSNIIDEMNEKGRLIEFKASVISQIFSTPQKEEAAILLVNWLKKQTVYKIDLLNPPRPQSRSGHNQIRITC